MSETVELRLYSPLQIDIINRDAPGRAIPFQAVSYHCRSEYTRIMLIDQARASCGGNHKESVYWLTDHLLAMKPEQILNFHSIMHGYMELANKYGLWNAALIIQENGCYTGRLWNHDDPATQKARAAAPQRNRARPDKQKGGENR